MAHSGRLALLVALDAEGERSVGYLSNTADLPQALTSQQLKILRDYDLVAHRRDGNRVFYRINKPEVGRVLACLRKAGVLD